MEEKDEIVISLSDVWNIIKKNAAFIICGDPQKLDLKA